LKIANLATIIAALWIVSLMIGILGEVIAHKHVEMVFKHVLVISWFLQVVVESNVVPLFRIRNAIKRIAQLTVLLLIGILGVFALNHANLMVEQLVSKNVSELFFANLKMVENNVLQKNLTDIRLAIAMIMIAVPIVKLALGVLGAIAVCLVEMDTSRAEERSSIQRLVMAWIVLNFTKLIFVTTTPALPNVSMAKMFIKNVQLHVVHLTMISTAKSLD